MLDIQLGRRNLSPIQRIAVAEKYRPIYEKQAKENQLSGLKQNTVSVNLPKREIASVNTSEKLADIAGVSEKTYRMGAKVLNSDNEDIRQRVLSGETSISAGYKELQNKKQKVNESPKMQQEKTSYPNGEKVISGELKNIQCSPNGEKRSAMHTMHFRQKVCIFSKWRT